MSPFLFSALKRQNQFACRLLNIGEQQALYVREKFNMKKIYILFFPILLLSCQGEISESDINSDNSEMLVKDEEILELEESTIEVDESLKELEEHAAEATKEIDSLLKNI